MLFRSANGSLLNSAVNGQHGITVRALTADGYASVRNLPKSLTGDALKAALAQTASTASAAGA